MLTVQMSTLPTDRLRQFLGGLPRGGVTALAGRLGVHPVYLSQLAARQNGREPSPELCVSIERATEGAVTRRDLRPHDWDRIWPELIGAEAAPVSQAVEVVHAS